MVSRNGKVNTKNSRWSGTFSGYSKAATISPYAYGRGALSSTILRMSGIDALGVDAAQLLGDIRKRTQQAVTEYDTPRKIRANSDTAYKTLRNPPQPPAQRDLRVRTIYGAEFHNPAPTVIYGAKKDVAGHATTRKAVICGRRNIRKAVILAKGYGGGGRRRKAKFNANSQVRC